MAKIISLFNHKGGVSKTTTTFNLGWTLAEKGKRVIVVDTDPQCNLTGIVLGFQGIDDFSDFYSRNPGRNIRDALAPAFESKPERIRPLDCPPVADRSGLYLLPGHLGLSEYEVTLGIAQELSSSIQALKNLPGSLNYLLTETSRELSADYIIVDMSPSVSSLNQNLLMISDYFIIPCSPDYFCSLAIDSLSQIMPLWKTWADRAANTPTLLSGTYPFPQKNPKLLGTIAQRFRPRYGAPASGFQRWIDDISRRVQNKLVPALRGCGMAFDDATYESVGLTADSYDLAHISDFNTLITLSHQHGIPPFALSDEQLGRVGSVLEQMRLSRDNFHQTFCDLAERVLALSGRYDVGN